MRTLASFPPWKKGTHKSQQSKCVQWYSATWPWNKYPLPSLFYLLGVGMGKIISFLKRLPQPQACLHPKGNIFIPFLMEQISNLNMYSKIIEAVKCQHVTLPSSVTPTAGNQGNTAHCQKGEAPVLPPLDLQRCERPSFKFLRTSFKRPALGPRI